MKKTLILQCPGMVCSPPVVSKCLGEAHRRLDIIYIIYITLHYITLQYILFFFFSILLVMTKHEGVMGKNPKSAYKGGTSPPCMSSTFVYNVLSTVQVKYGKEKDPMQPSKLSLVEWPTLWSPSVSLLKTFSLTWRHCRMRQGICRTSLQRFANGHFMVKSCPPLSRLARDCMTIPWSRCSICHLHDHCAVCQQAHSIIFFRPEA